MVEIKDLNEYRPHLMVVAIDGVHVQPPRPGREHHRSRKAPMLLTEPVLRRALEEWRVKVTQ